MRGEQKRNGEKTKIKRGVLPSKERKRYTTGHLDQLQSERMEKRRKKKHNKIFHKEIHGFNGSDVGLKIGGAFSMSHSTVRDFPAISLNSAPES